MLISLNWLRDFVEIPASLSPKELALQFTITTAEVDGVHEHVVATDGLLAARTETVRTQPGEARLKAISLDAGAQKYASLTTAPDIATGDIVVFAPPGARVGDQTLGETDSAGRASQGMIVAWGALGFPHIGAHAVKLPPSTRPGTPIDAALFHDWIIEIDNKSITHRPDCWGHYGIAREMAAMLRQPLAPYDVTPTASLVNSLPATPIEIDDPEKCPRYTGLSFRGLAAQPSPLWIQTRLAHCGMRPIDLIVDLTNYVMLELGQPMHAFDAEKVSNIQVAVAQGGTRFRTLDGVDRVLPEGTLMIQSDRKNVAIAGIMGGAETEVSAGTTTIFLESATFDAPTIRRAATAMGHRTEASARFEKSLDPHHTVLGIARFHKLAKNELPNMELAGTLSDCFPNPKTPESIVIDCDFAARFIGPLSGGGRITPEIMLDIFERLSFNCERIADASGAVKLRVTPPTYRATKDISLEADLLEEIARFVGYNNIEPSLPRVSARHFEPSKALTVEERTLTHFCAAGEFAEVHNYIWYDDDWLKTIGFEPGECITLQNPAADNCSRLRKTLAPGLIAIAERNRHHFDRFQLIEIGSVFQPGVQTVEESQRRVMGLMVAQQGKKVDGLVWERMKLALAGWARQLFEHGLSFRQSTAAAPWEDPDRTAEVVLGGKSIGRATMLPPALLMKLDERLRAWSFATAEIDLTQTLDLLRYFEKLPVVPRFPQADLDFSVLVTASRRYEDVAARLASHSHDLLKRLVFVGAYDGGAIPEGKRSLLFRARIGRDDRTLTDDEIQAFNASFRAFLTEQGLELRA